MPRKPVATPAPQTSVPEDKPIARPAPVLPPKTKVLGEGKRTDDGNKTTNEIVVQRVSVPFTTKSRGEEKTEFKDYFRIFVRPDESHDEPDASFDEHEPEDEAALKRIFATYGKGDGTTISIRLNVDDAGKEEFFLDVQHPKPEGDDDAKLPMVLIDPKDSIGDIVTDLFYEMSSEDPPDDFVTRGALDDLVEELKGDLEELDPARAVLSEFDMPGDLPAHLYSLPERLRSIFRKAKGLDG
jgi:hypothetical protein